MFICLFVVCMVYVCNACKIAFTLFVSYIWLLIGYFRAFIRAIINYYSVLTVSITK